MDGLLLLITEGGSYKVELEVAMELLVVDNDLLVALDVVVFDVELVVESVVELGAEADVVERT